MAPHIGSWGAVLTGKKTAGRGASAKDLTEAARRGHAPEAKHRAERDEPKRQTGAAPAGAERAKLMAPEWKAFFDAVPLYGGGDYLLMDLVGNWPNEVPRELLDKH